MSRQSPRSRGARDFSSPQIRVRGVDDFRYHPNQRLRVPNERTALRTRFGQLLRVLLAVGMLGGIGIGVYLGVIELTDNDSSPESPAAAVDQAETATNPPTEPTTGTATTAASADSKPAAATDTEREPPAAQESTVDQTAPTPTSPAADSQETPTANSASSDSGADVIHPARAEPLVAAAPVTPGEIGGAPLTTERVTAEAVPEGIPRNLADGSDYDPTEPATVFSNLWPVGTTLRLTRLPGATLLSDEEQAEVIGAEVLVVVRGLQDSNTDLQLSPAAFDQVAVYGVERIIAVAVEVTAAPP